MILFDKIYKFYQDNFETLKTKQFHFASRLYLWNGDKYYGQKLQDMSAQFLAENFLSRDYTHRQEALAKFDETRLKHIQKFPRLLEWHDILIQGLYGKTVYGQDFLPEVKKLVSKQDLLDLEKELKSDQKAMAWLATYSISFLYFVHRYFLADEDQLDLAFIKDVGLNNFDRQNPYELNLQIYYFTHCIIGESLFYARPLPQQHQSFYLELIKIVETIISDHYTMASLDHKLEFLMCCKICDYKSDLENKIFDEANQSLSHEGNFVVDKFNYYQVKKGGFNLYEAEHQNVLYLMACQDFSPHALILV